jgi:hypothetical protein
MAWTRSAAAVEAAVKRGPTIPLATAWPDEARGAGRMLQKKSGASSELIADEIMRKFSACYGKTRSNSRLAGLTFLLDL